MSLSPAEIRRYSRQMVIPEVGRQGQERLKAASVLMVGAGGLGSPAALYLAAAGVGRLGIVEFDSVDLSNLQRQILYSEADVGRPKLAAASRRLAEVNPHLELIPIADRFSSQNALELVADYDVIVDGSDNFATRYLVNDACVLAGGKPDVFGSVLRFEGQVSIFATAEGPCYRCLFPEPPPPGLVPSCAEGGVFGVLPGIIGALQAQQAIQWILGLGEPLIGRFLVFDGLGSSFREIQLDRNPNCPICSAEPTLRELTDYDDLCTETGTEPPDGAGELPFDVEATQVGGWLGTGRDFLFLDVRTPMEFSLARVEGATLLPLNELPRRFGELDRDRETVVMCHHGIRSAKAVAFLRQQGFANVRNLAGGIDSWSRAVDSSIPLY